VRWRRRLPLALLLFVPLACAHPSRSTHRPARPPTAETRGDERPPPAPVPEPPPRPDREDEARGAEEETGIASFYAHRFHGRRTASGVRYDMHAMTCAHPNAPFGTRLRVTDVETGRSVVVVVNDRGPFARGRVVDLSLAAAKRLGIVKRGLARVKVERVE
jgi:rare lipoprotein A